MVRKIIYFICLIFLANCSVDTKTGLWENKNQPKITTKLSELEFEYETNFNQFKENIIQYGKLGDYPKLDN